MGTVVVRIQCLQDSDINSNLSKGCRTSERSKRSRRRTANHDGNEEIEHRWVSRTIILLLFLHLPSCRYNSIVEYQLTENRSVVGSLKDVEEALDFTARDLVHVRIRFFLCTSIADKMQPILTKGKLTDLDDFMDRVSFHTQYIHPILTTVTDEQGTASWSSCFASGGMMVMTPWR